MLTGNHRRPEPDQVSITRPCVPERGGTAPPGGGPGLRTVREEDVLQQIDLINELMNNEECLMCECPEA